MDWGQAGAHYCGIKGPTYLPEYEHVQNETNHVHALRRDLRQGRGSDLLAAHYAGRLCARAHWQT